MEKTTKRRRNISPENLAEAARLKVIWERTKDERRARGVYSQGAFGLEFEIGNQAAVGFFLNGEVPLSLKAAKGFANGLGITIGEFSPRLASEIQNLAAGISPVRSPNHQEETPPGSSPLIAGEAHPLTLYARTVPPTVTWEWVMQAREPLMKEFRVVMPDDALAPKVIRGTTLEFDTGKTPRFGDGVLVADSAGRRCIRVYMEGHAGQWRAAPLNSAYATLESDRDGLAVLATLSAVVDGKLV